MPHQDAAPPSGRPSPLTARGALTAGAVGGGAALVIGLVALSGVSDRDLSIATAILGAGALGVSIFLRQARRAAAAVRVLEARIEDLTDRAWELGESLERSRSLLEAHGDLIVRRNDKGAITYANDAFLALVGDDARDAGFALKVIEQGASRSLDDGTRTYDQKIATAAGPRWIAWREVPVRDHVRDTAEFQSVGRDVTDRIEAERALLDTRDQAEAASRAKSRFLAMVSHEIRTPLNGILGMADLIIDTPLTPEQKTYAKAIKRSGDALLSLIEEVLDFSKIEAGKIDIKTQPFALPVLIEELIELLAPRAQAKALELAYLVDAELALPVVGDATRLRQVLLNLVGNAIKFTETGGVCVRVAPTAETGVVAFCVEDTGIGIAPDAQARIFLEFEQAEGGSARRHGGTGLGLAISKRLVERMGGSIGVTSEAGRGSRFHFTAHLPHAGIAGDAVQPPRLDGAAILIAAATRVEAPIIATLLGQWGARTCLVQDAAVARALLPEQAWQALIVDHRLPGAAELARAARGDVARRLILIAPAERADLERLKDDFTSYLVKPVRPSSLAARLSEIGPSLIPLDDGAGAAPEPREEGRAILVAEDNEINALLANALLLKLGHRPTLVTNGALAVEAVAAARGADMAFDLVLMDVHMPEMDGLEATRRIRALEGAFCAAPLPIVALTANAFDEDRDACLAAGMNDYLTKPLDRERLAEVLSRLLQGLVAA